MEKSTKVFLVFYKERPKGLGNSQRIAYKSAGHIVAHLLGRFRSRNIPFANVDSNYTIKIFDYEKDSTETMTGREFCLIYGTKKISSLEAVFGFPIDSDVAFKMYKNGLCAPELHQELTKYFATHGIK